MNLIVMKVKRVLLIICSRVARSVGMGLGASGILVFIWLCFLSSNDNKCFLVGLSIGQFFGGYLMYRFAYSCICDEWS